VSVQGTALPVGFVVADSHTHIDMPEDAGKPINRPHSAGGSVWFDAGLTVRWGLGTLGIEHMKFF